MWCGTCSLPLEYEHTRLSAEGPQVGRAGNFWVLPFKGQGLACYRAWMKNALAFLAFSCEIVPNSGAVLYPLLFSKDAERYFSSPLWLWDSRALEAWYQADFL